MFHLTVLDGLATHIEVAAIEVGRAFPNSWSKIRFCDKSALQFYDQLSLYYKSMINISAVEYL